MTIQYKNQGINLTTTGTVSVLTCPSDATILIKLLLITDPSDAVNLNVQLRILLQQLPLEYTISQLVQQLKI